MDEKSTGLKKAESASGPKGEQFAAEVLEQTGYRILHRNYFTRYGEIDIIACDAQFLCFIEVKTRRKGSMVTGTQAVGKSKQKKLITAALHYMQQTNCKLQPRFDVFVIVTDRGEICSHDYLTGAFDCDGYFQ